MTNKLYDTDSMPFSFGSNDLGAAATFQFRKHWHINGMSTDMVDVPPINLWSPKLFHGRINGKGEVVYPSETNLKQLPSDSDETHWALDFVVDAFVELQLHIKRSLGKGQLLAESKLTKLNPSRSWVSANLDYNIYIEALYNHLVTFWFQENYRSSSIKNFADFLREFLELVDDASSIMPFTKSAYILSRHFSPLSSGLIIEVDRGDHSLDLEKQLSWVEDPNFSFYRSAAKDHGFLIDKNAPWRLIADVNSAPMTKYMSQYGVTGKDLFDTYYYKSHRLDIETLKIYLIEMYNAYIAAYPEVREFRTKLKGAGGMRTVSRLVTRFPTTLEEVNEKFPPEYWLKTYYYIRLREMQAPIDNVAFNNDVEKIYRRYKFLDFDKTLDYINGKIRKLKVP